VTWVCVTWVCVTWAFVGVASLATLVETEADRRADSPRRPPAAPWPLHDALRRGGLALGAGLALSLAAVAAVAPPASAQAGGGDEADAAADADATRPDEEIDSLRAEIAASRERVVAHEREERNLLHLLERIDRGLEKLREDVEASERRAAAAQAEWASVQDRMRAVEARLADTRRAMSRRAVALYKTGEAGPLRMLFASVDLQEMLWKVSTLGRLLRYDARLVDRFAREEAELRAVEEQAERALAARDAARARLASRSAILQEERAARRELLERVRSDRSQERALLVELERAARALEETLAGLDDTDVPAAALDGSAFERRRGRLGWPAEGSVRSGFGRVVDADYQTETFRNGIEIAAAPGESVRAVARGQVRYAGWFRGYGKIVIVDHGGGYFTVSGHLADIYVAVGDLVEAGDTLGSVGDTGSLRGPSLYFEVRAGSQPLDPAQWLAKG